MFQANSKVCVCEGWGWSAEGLPSSVIMWGSDHFIGGPKTSIHIFHGHTETLSSSLWGGVGVAAKAEEMEGEKRTRILRFLSTSSPHLPFQEGASPESLAVTAVPEFRAASL